MDLLLDVPFALGAIRFASLDLPAVQSLQEFSWVKVDASGTSGR
jgi:hypothetical protein